MGRTRGERKKRRVGSERISTHFHEQEEMGEDGNVSSPLSFTEVFEELCPEYMAMGMTYDEYWNGDPVLPKYYRKMTKIKNKQRNRELWLQGMYIYEALCDASPLFRSLDKHPKPLPYSSEPYSLDEEEKKQKEERKAKREAEKMQAEMEAWMKKVNKRR